MATTDQLSNLPTRVIYDEGEYQHTLTETEAKVSALYPLLEALSHYIANNVNNTEEEALTIKINQYADDIVAQLLKDNTKELDFITENVAVCNTIIAQATLMPDDALILIKSIRLIFLQYQGLLEYIAKYQEAYKYSFSDDDLKHILYFNKYVDSVVEAYVYKLGETTQEIDKLTTTLTKRALYTFLLQADINLIEPNTQIQNYVAMIQAVQNNRIYRNRELMIIAINEAVAVSNLIRLMWLLIKLNYNALIIGKDSSVYDELKKLLDEFEKTRDTELLDKILDIIKKFEDELKDKESESTDASRISADLIAIGKLKDKSAIQRYIDTLDAFIAKINGITLDLVRFNYALDYSNMQSMLNRLSVIQDLLDKLLGDSDFSKYYNKINEVITAINRTIEAIKAVNCLIKQAMCLIASVANFKNSILAPAIQNIQNTIKRLGNDTETIIDNFARDALEPFNDAIKVIIYEQARIILKGRAYQVTTELGKDATFTTTCNSVIDAVINAALGNGTSAMDYLKGISNKAINDIASSFTPDERQSTNCPPVTIKGSLSIPNLSLQTNLPSINDIKLSVEC